MQTNIYAITDSHQESRNLSRLLSGIYNLEKSSAAPFLVLDAGDLFKGIYDKELSVNAYIKLKQLLPQAQIFLTLGNNDFGFTKADFEYLKHTIKVFESAGINFVCANLIDSVSWVDEYKIIEINGQKILITGFCLNNSCTKKFKCDLMPPEQSFENLIKSIQADYDKIIVLNHHWYTYSKSLKDFALSRGVDIDLIIGGHEHSKIVPNFEDNIFYPLSFARSMYKMTMGETISNIEEISLEQTTFIPEFETPILEYEQKTGLKQPIARRVLNLTKCYSEPCPLGTFISDSMKNVGKTDIAFHSTGFTMYPLRLSDSNTVTKYDLERVMCPTTSAIEKIKISVEQLKQVFENAAKFRMLKDRGNSRFLQCSRNIKITGKGNPKDKTYTIVQIEIDGELLLDENAKPINPARIFTCTIDDFIGKGEQGFDVLKSIPKTEVLKNGTPVLLSELFYNSVIEAENLYQTSVYPVFGFIDL